MYKFLSDDWFAKLDQLKSAAGDLNVSDAMASVSINLLVRHDDVEIPLQVSHGIIERGSLDDASTTLIIDSQTLKKVFFQFDTMAAMQAFMTGKIKVQGDMTKVMALQAAKPSAEQKKLCQDILALTV